MSEVAIKVEGLGKQYRIGGKRGRYKTLRESIAELARAPFRKGAGNGSPDNTFWALKDVALEINQGEVVGIIGRNGAGKSTLLKIISRITDPTEGQVEIVGRVGSLLEVGTGFHPELTGRENIYLNGAILGMTRREINAKFDQIIAFAETEKFLDTPVKFYSSGMYTRLAFAVAAHLEPEILIVDEVLAVGDAEFQKKCLGKMKDISVSGHTTVMFVSHNLAAINSLCDRCVLLSSGRVLAAGSTRDVVNQYLNQADLSGIVNFDLSKNPSSALVARSCSVVSPAGAVTATVAVTEPFSIRVELLCRQPVPGVELSLRIENSEGVRVFTTHLSDGSDQLAKFIPGDHAFEVRVPQQFLAPGGYNITIGVHSPNVEMFDYHAHALAFEVEEVGSSMAKYPGENFGVVLVNFPWKRLQPADIR